MKVRHKRVLRLPTAAILTLLLSAAIFPAVAADERKLTGEDILTLLSDRTALGENRGKATRQYFDPAGWTDYLEQGGRPDRGKWRVDKARGQYCSQWGNFGGWSCYDVTTDEDRYYWTQPGTDYHSPFTVVKGYQMKF